MPAKRRLSMFTQAFSFIMYLLHHGDTDAQLLADFIDFHDNTTSNINGPQPYPCLLLPKWMVRPPPIGWENVVLDASWDNIVAVLRLDRLAPATHTFIRLIIRNVVSKAPAAATPAAAAAAPAAVTDGSAPAAAPEAEAAVPAEVAAEAK